MRLGGLLFITYMHKAEGIDQALAAADEAPAVVAEAVASGDVRAYLQTREVEEGFRRF